jgi:hypothetical protein
MPQKKKGGIPLSDEKTREIRISLPEELFSILFPEKAIGHVVKAKKEMLLAIRSLIDARIEALEKIGTKGAQKKKTSKKKKIVIE